MVLLFVAAAGAAIADLGRRGGGDAFFEKRKRRVNG